MHLFASTFERLLANESPASLEGGLELLFEWALRTLCSDKLKPDEFFDGVVILSSQRRKGLQIDIEGEVIIGRSFGAWPPRPTILVRMTDKRITRQGLHLSLFFRESRTESSLEELDALREAFEENKRPPGCPDGLG